jgi:subtilase family serine protease
MSAKRRPACQPRFDHVEGRALLVTLTPPIIKTAYNANHDYDDINGQNVAPNGSGQTIAIVVDGIDANIIHDYKAFDALYGQQPDFSFAQYAMPGATLASADWDLEISTDVEWAHSFAQKSNIVLVEAANTSAGMFAAVNHARALSGVSVVSMSWGSAEVPADQSYNSIFTTPAGHIGVTFVAASGDDGGYNNPPAHTNNGVNFPASDPNVLAVGWSVLTTDSSGTGQSVAGSNLSDDEIRFQAPGKSTNGIIYSHTF